MNNSYMSYSLAGEGGFRFSYYNLNFNCNEGTVFWIPCTRSNVDSRRPDWWKTRLCFLHHWRIWGISKRFLDNTRYVHLNGNHAMSRCFAHFSYIILGPSRKIIHHPSIQLRLNRIKLNLPHHWQKEDSSNSHIPGKNSFLNPGLKGQTVSLQCTWRFD